MLESMFPTGFFWKFAIVLVGGFSIAYIGNRIVRKRLKVEKRKAFSYNFINDFHKKGEWIIRLSFISFYIILFMILPQNENFSLYMAISLAVLFIVLAVFRAAVEKKHSKNPNDYLYSLFETGWAFFVFYTLAFLLFPEIWNS